MTRVAPWHAAMAAVFMLLAWRVIHVNAVVYGETNRPVTRVLPGESAAEVASAALRANPAEVRALLVRAREHEQAGDGERASRAYASALELAPVDRAALHEAAAADLRHGRTAEAVGRLDALVSHYEEARPAVFPVFARMLANPAHRALLEARAVRDPAWMDTFVPYACANADPQYLAPIFLKRAAAGKARREEVVCVIEKLRRAGRWDVAYQVWLNTLPRARLAEVGHVFNGGFEHPASGLGFDWIAEDAPGHTVDFAPAVGSAGVRALRVTYTGKRLAGPALRQYLAVPPGRYELSGRVRLEALQSVRGIQWVLRCGLEARGKPIAASEPFLGSGEWRRFALDAVIPGGCPGQVLSLEPVGLDEGTTFVSGTARFDELRLARAR